MTRDNVLEFVYLDWTGIRAYELTEDEKEWLIGENRPARVLVAATTI